MNLSSGELPQGTAQVCDTPSPRPATQWAPLRLRPVLAVPDTVPTRDFVIYHHGYTPRRLVLNLSSSPADPDGNLDDDSNYVLPLALVLQACKFLANNEPGNLYLSSNQPLQSESDQRQVSGETIMPGEYMYRLDNTEYDFCYPLCGKFSHWKPGDVPESWLFDGRRTNVNDLLDVNKSAASSVVKATDEFCVITRSSARLDSAHLVPTSETQWFATHAFSVQAGDAKNPSVDTTNNRIALRADINGRGLDSGDFCFYPYGGKWMVVWMGPGSRQLAREHNLREVELPLRIRAAYLFARFAWNIFHLAAPYLKQQPDLDFVASEEGDGNLREEKDEDGDEGGIGRGTGRRGGGAPRGDGGGRGHGGGRGGGGGGGNAPAPTSAEPQRPEKRQRHALAHLAGQAAKKIRTDAVPSHDLDLALLNPKCLQVMKRIDHRVQAGEVPYDQNSDWYPGFSRVAEVAYDYRLSHPAATDPGGARIAFISEREEE
ncbi:hypothetical protein B0H15DRAFT_1024898 [Mycena belliarum]|uniref:HNH nuclease domain-containing protein n=1 Tax=Mycena belliarum TaxID=1033014 RepID=A0AAD6U1D4_9AGAR|nr:hypothetical protein B0H15DRAFT_1024898 [Mycena belliae]